MDIAGLGEKTAEDMVQKGLTNDIADLYTLSEDDLLGIAGFAEKSATQLYEAIQNAGKPQLDRFLYGLGIRHVDRRVAHVLAEKFPSLDTLRKAGKNNLANLEEIGPEIAESIKLFFEQEDNRSVLARLAKAGVKTEEMPSFHKTLPLKGKTFVFTGKLKDYTRVEAKTKVETLGGRANSAVSSKTDYAVVGKDLGRKLEEAKKQKVKIVKE